MFAITLKVILAFILSAIPFGFHVWVKPKQASTPKLRNLATVAHCYFPRLKREARKAKVFLLRIYRKMGHSDNARNLFTLMLVLSLLTLQFVDFESSTAAGSLAQAKVKANMNACVFKSALLGKMWEGEEGVINIYYPFQTPYFISLVSFVCTLALFSFHAADGILSFLHRNMVGFWFVAEFLILLMLMSCGRFLCLAESGFLILMAAALYPNRDVPLVPKWKKPIDSLSSKKDGKQLDFMKRAA